MRTYIYVADNFSDARGYNRTIRVWRIKQKKPCYVGYDEKINTASYVGDRGIAYKIISNKDGLKMKGSYELKSKNVQLFEV